MGKNGRFTNTDVERLEVRDREYKVPLGDKLYVRIRPNGHKTYVLIYRPKFGPHRGEKIRLTFGPTTLHIQAARQWARDMNTLIAQGKDPHQEQIAKRQSDHLAALRSKTFGQLAQEYVDKKSNPEDTDPWSPRYADAMRGVQKRIVGDAKRKVPAMAIAELPVDQLAPADFENVINDVGRHAPTMGKRFSDFMFGAMKLGKKRGYYQGDNPADPEKLESNIKHASTSRYGWKYPKLPRLWRLLCEAESEREHDGLLTTSQAAKATGLFPSAIYNRIILWDRSQGRAGLPAKQLGLGKTATYLIDPVDLLKLFPNANLNVELTLDQAHVAIAILKFLLLTGLRFSEVNEMPWEGEVDWVKKVWTIPPERTKAKRKHVVPLTEPMLEILEKRKACRNPNKPSPYVFAQGEPLTGEGKYSGRPLSGTCVLKHLKRISGDLKYTIHSFRRGVGSWADSQFIRLGGGVLRKYDINFRRAILGHAVSNGLDYVYGSDADYEKPCRILLNDWWYFLENGPSEPSEFAEVVELSTRRIAGA